MFVFSTYSIHFFFSLFFFSNRLKCNNTQGGAGQDATGRTTARTATRDSNEGQDRGAGGREEEGDGCAGVLKGGGERVAGGAEWGAQRVADGSVADKEDEILGQGGGWATLPLS